MGLTRLIGAALLVLWPLAAPAAETVMRVAVYAPDLGRKGPGLLLRDIRDAHEQVDAAATVIAAAAPDVILLTGFDWDHDGLALTAFADLLADKGADFPHRFAARPNSGMATGLDLDGDGRAGSGDDAQGFGLFTGSEGMAILSRLPIGPVVDHSATLWRDLPGNLMPPDTPPEIAAVQRLSSTAHWDVTVKTGAGPLHLLAWSATPPVFDDERDRNGRRNHDEAVFWLTHLPPDAPWVLIGNTNLDPVDGEGRREAMARLLQITDDPAPRGEWQPPQDGANSTQQGDPALDTADWPDADGPGNMRVDVILPQKGLVVRDSGVIWPAPDDPLADAVTTASRHRLVWVDLVLP